MPTNAGQERLKFYHLALYLTLIQTRILLQLLHQHLPLLSRLLLISLKVHLVTESIIKVYYIYYIGGGSKSKRGTTKVSASLDVADSPPPVCMMCYTHVHVFFVYFRNIIVVLGSRQELI